MLRHQLPVHSPIGVEEIFRGFQSFLVGGDQARRHIRTALLELYGAADIVLTDSGTSALTLALEAVREKDRTNPVALPAYGCYDLVTAAVGADIPVVLYDLDPSTLGPDLESLEALASEGIAAIVVAHLYGLPVDIEPILTLGKRHQIVVIEDAAQGAGASYRGRQVGSLGDLSVLSFGRGKGTTGGGGGALLVNDDRGQRLFQPVKYKIPEGDPLGCRILPTLMAMWLFGRPSLYWFPKSLPFGHLGETVYKEPEPVKGFPAISAGALRAALGKAPQELAVRRALANTWRRLLREVEGAVAIEEVQGADPGYLRFPLRADGGLAKLLSDGRAARFGVASGYPTTLARLPEIRSRLNKELLPLPGAQALARQIFTLPTHSSVTRHDQIAVQQILAS